tara:strand:+ start:879 stop:1160 length:282 start_codon:yes stop_codon:yes gene_type:complete
VFIWDFFALFVQALDKNNRWLFIRQRKVFRDKINLDPNRRLVAASFDFHSDKSMKKKPPLVNYYFEKIFFGAALIEFDSQQGKKKSSRSCPCS